MNKRVMNAFKDFNISYNGNYGYGDMNGYEVNIYNSPMNQGPVLAISSYMLLSQKTDFVSKLNSRKFKLVKADTFEYGVMIMIGAMTGKSFEKNLRLDVGSKTLLHAHAFGFNHIPIGTSLASLIGGLDAILSL